MAVVKAFIITSAPFLLAEITTGTISFASHELSIPPLLGVGTLVDSVILAAGLLVALWRLMRREKTTEPT